MIHFIYIIILIYFNSAIGYINNAQWLALQIAWFAQWIHRCTLVVAKVRVWFLVKHKFVQLFFNHLGCSFYCKRSSWLSYFTNATFPKAFQTAQNFFQLGDKKVTKEFFLRASYSVGFRVKKSFFCHVEKREWQLVIAWPVASWSDLPSWSTERDTYFCCYCGRTKS